MPAAPSLGSIAPVLARHLFNKTLQPCPVYYQFPSPRKQLLESRFSPLYLLAEASAKNQASPTSSGVNDSSKLSAEAVPFYPLSTVIDKLTDQKNWLSGPILSGELEPRHES